MTRRGAIIAACLALAGCLTAAASHAHPSTLLGVPPAQAGGQGRGAAAPAAAKASAPVDLTGYWVAFISEDWRYRMVTPQKGDYRGVPLTAEGTRVANMWNPAAAEPEPCKAYGAPGILRIPGRLHIVWQDDNTLRLDTDAGTQTRLFRFGAAPAATGPATWQGSSTARWERAGRGAGAGGGSLTVVTTNARAGYLRRNGVPYSANAVVTEYFTRVAEPNGDAYLLVTTIVEDPQYLNSRFARSSHFKREADGSKWKPSACE